MLAQRIINLLFKSLCAIAALGMAILFAGLLAVLIFESWPAFRKFGLLDFILSSDWNYAREVYGALRPLLGTILTALMAMIIAMPVAMGTAIFLTELCPYALRSPIGVAIELLAAIPSIIYGLWGLFVLAPLMEDYVQPLAAQSFGRLPVIGFFFQTPYPGGLNIATASLVLSIMIMPFMASLAKEALLRIPAMLKESAYGLGATRWENISQIAIPFARKALMGGAIMSLGRALGETMAVSYAIGNSHGALESIFSPYLTITSVLAGEFNEADGLLLSSLFALSAILIISNLIIVSLSRRFFDKGAL
jgi:phosphate transport system permease protein